MPISAVSPLIRIHSWSFVYFRSGGYAMALRPLVEREWDDACGGGAAADVDGEVSPRCGQFRRHVRHADRLLQKRRLRPAGHNANPLVAGDHRVAVTGDAAIDHLEPDQLARHALVFLLAQPLFADESGL